MRAVIAGVACLLFATLANPGVEAFSGLVGCRGQAAELSISMTKNADDLERIRTDHVGRRALLTTAASLLVSVPSVALADTLHKIDYPIEGKCGQAEVPENAVFFVKQFGGFTDGSCATEGYTVEDGTANGTGEKDKERTYEIYTK